jgi:hypothetical protein
MKVVHSQKPRALVGLAAAAHLSEPAPPELPAPQPAIQIPPAVEPAPPEPPAPQPAEQPPTHASRQPSPIVAAEIPKKPSPMPRIPREISNPQRARAVTSAAVAPRFAPPARIAIPAPSVPTPLPVPPTIAPPPVRPEPEYVTPVSPEASVVPAPQPRQVTLNAGSVLPVRLVEGLSSERNAAGDTFAATLDQEVVANGFVIAGRGARVEGRVIAVDRARVRASALALELTSLHTSDGQTVRIQTEGFFKHAEAGEVDDATKIAGGAVLGAAIGALAGGGKGAAIGAGLGGGAGAGVVVLTHRPAELGSETLLTFKLRTAVPMMKKVR